MRLIKHFSQYVGVPFLVSCLPRDSLWHFPKDFPVAGGWWLLVRDWCGMQRREGNLVEGRMTALIAGHTGLLTGLISVKWRAARGKLLTTSSCGLTSRRKWYSEAQPKELQKMLIHEDRGQTREAFDCTFYQENIAISYCNYPNSPRGLSCLGIFFSQAVVFISDDCSHQELYRKIYRSLWCNEIPYNAFKLYEIWNDSVAWIAWYTSWIFNSSKNERG